MKTQFVADDGKIFTNREDALKYEANKKSDDAGKKQLMEKIEKIDQKIEALVKEVNKLDDEKNQLLDEYRDKYLNDRQKKLLNDLEGFVDMLFGGRDGDK